MSDENTQNDTENDEAGVNAPGTDGDDAAQAAEVSLAEEVATLKDQLLRALAENENFRKRAEKERQDTAKYAVSNFARDILAVADNLRRAIDSVPDEALEGNDALQSLAEGVDLTERELITALERHGVTAIQPSAGDRFDPHQHQAMFEVEDPSVPAGSVIQVMQTGYMIHDRLLRAAMVGVAKGGPARGPDEQGEAGSGVDTTA
ncbi:MAG: nucleotide exchange factor GrpE [Alphaproteobacteria bacterium]